jgi:hypothetical protein
MNMKKLLRKLFCCGKDDAEISRSSYGTVDPSVAYAAPKTHISGASSSATYRNEYVAYKNSSARVVGRNSLTRKAVERMEYIYGQQPCR